MSALLWDQQHRVSRFEDPIRVRSFEDRAVDK